MNKLTAALIVKNEAAVLARTIASLAGRVGGVVMIDTGSTDDTLGVAIDACLEHRLPLWHARRPWVDYGANRTELLALAREWTGGAGYTVVVDADEELRGELPAEPLSAAGYHLLTVVAGDFEVRRRRILSNALPWAYRGALHEVPVLEGHTTPDLDRLWLENSSDGAQGSQDIDAIRARYARDAEYFRAQLDRNPDDTRSAYYLAQSLHDAGKRDDAKEAYWRRFTMIGGNQDEVQVSLLQLARYAAHDGGDPTVDYHLAAKHSPKRLCAHVELAAWHNHRGEFDAAEAAAAKACAIDHPTGRFLTRKSYREWRRYAELHRAQMGLGIDATMAAAKVIESPAPRHVKLYAAQSLNRDVA